MALARANAALGEAYVRSQLPWKVIHASVPLLLNLMSIGAI